MSKKVWAIAIVAFAVAAGLVAYWAYQEGVSTPGESPVEVAATAAPGPKGGVYWSHPAVEIGYAKRVYESEDQAPKTWVLCVEDELWRNDELLQTSVFSRTYAPPPVELGEGLFVEYPLPVWEQNFEGTATDMCRLRWLAYEGVVKVDEVLGYCVSDDGKLANADERGFRPVRTVVGRIYSYFFPLVMVGGK